jgi:hypothetical protein
MGTSEITCKPTKFDAAAEDQDVTMTITFNGKSTTTTLGVTTSPAAVSSVSPASISPVLKDTLTIELSADLGTDESDYTVYLTHTPDDSDDYDSTKDKTLNVETVSGTTLEAAFGGAWSGTYTVNVVSDTFGYLDSEVTLSVGATITSWGPKMGSIYGGNLITITGENFSDDGLNNPVNVGWDHCDIISSSTTEIVARAPIRYDSDGVQEIEEEETFFIVALKTSEEATCGDADGCLYNYLESSTPEWTGIADSYDSATGEITLTFSGSGFGSSAEVFLDGLAQTVSFASDTQVIAVVSDLATKSVAVIDFIPESGRPYDDTELATDGYSFDYDLYEVTSAHGSTGGGKVVLTAPAVGTSTADVDILSSGASFCSSVEVVAYQTVVCTYGATSGTKSLDLQVASTTYECRDGSSTDACDLTLDLSPEVTSIAFGSNTVTLTGSGFSITDFTSAWVSVAGMSADEVTVNGDTSVSATFDMGVPITNGAISPVLAFASDDEDELSELYAVMSATLTNELDITAVNSPDCSWAGGCALTIESTGTGLATAMNQGEAVVTVCDNVCVIDTDESAENEAVCYLPALHTVTSMNDFSLEAEDMIYGSTNFADTDGQEDAAWDGSNDSNYVSEASTSGDTYSCNFGTEFDSGKRGLLKSVAYMMNYFDRDLLVDNLEFQGSDDGALYTTLHSVSEEIHQGFNNIAFEEGSRPAYKFYRFLGSAATACKIGEVQLNGWIVTADADDASSHECTPSLTFDAVAQDLSSTVTYQAALTPAVDSISPGQVSVIGGDEVTFTGTDFSTSTSAYTIEIDGKTCTVTSATSTQVVCTSAERTGIVSDHTIVFRIAGYGQATLNGQDVLYVNKWSETDTWGGELPPMTGESVHIPVGLNLLVDVDTTDILNLILVEGTLIFAADDDASHQRTFHAHIIFINGGHLIAGTEDEPYTSNLDIVLHGEKYGPTLPTFGNKCIANHGGIVDIHGVERTSWTELKSTASEEDTEITLNSAVDWVVGDKIMLAPTDYVFNEDEVFTITAIDNSDSDYPVVSLDGKILHKHFADTETFGSWELPMHGEVALLTRNIKVYGYYDDSAFTEYGAQIITHSDSNQDDASITRLEHLEMYHVGQAFLLGRYPIHFHRLGNVYESYIKGCSIYHAFNRAIVVHETNYLTVYNNVAYDVQGHVYFIEDGVERNNYFEKNLAVKCKRSWSLLNTDQMAACFFITNPDNIFRDNRAVASERMGFWFDLESHSTGPNFDVNVCPDGEKLGEFSGNHVHSNGMYGLRLFNTFVPKTKPCVALTWDSEEGDYALENDPEPAEFTELIGWKNGRSCAITKTTGDIRFVDFKCVDNAKSQIEFSMSGITRWGTAQVSGGLMVGYSAGNSGTQPRDLEFGMSDWEEAKGVTASRKEFFEINDVTFYNFDKSEAQSAIFDCSQCFFSDNEEHARTTRVSGLIFDSATVLYRLSFQTPFRGIFEDTDGSLSGTAGQFITAYWKHLDVDECEQSDSKLVDALVCDTSVQVRRVSFHGMTPTGTLRGQAIKIIGWDDSVIEALEAADETGEAYDAYVADDENYTDMKYDDKGAPSPGWHVPFVTGHKYKVSFGAVGLDFEKMSLQIEDLWESDDENIYFVFNHTDTRVAMNVFAMETNAWGSQTLIGQIEDETLFNSESTW